MEILEGSWTGVIKIKVSNFISFSYFIILSASTVFKKKYILLNFKVHYKGTFNTIKCTSSPQGHTFFHMEYL